MLEALLFGITLGITIGPLSLLVLANSAAYGFYAGLRLTIVLLYADFIFSAIAFSAGAVVTRFFSEQHALFARASSTILIGFGFWMLFSAWRSMKYNQHPPRTRLKTAFLLAMSNPLSIVMFMGFAGQLSMQHGWLSVLYQSLAVCIGAGGITLIFAALAASLRHFLSNPHYLGWLNGLSGCGIVAFGVRGWLGSC